MRRAIIAKEQLRWIFHHIAKSQNFSPLESSLEALAKSDLKREIKQVDEINGFNLSILKKYVHLHQPLLMKGAANDWECLNWSAESLSDQYPTETAVSTSDKEMSELTLEKSLKNLESKKIGDNSRVSHIIQHNKQLQREMNIATLKKAMGFPKVLTSYQFFFGQSGNVTKLHAGATNNLQIQIQGVKKWHLVAPQYASLVRPIINGEPLLSSYQDTKNPDYDRFPEQKFVPVLEAIHEKGDILFIPTFYWHQVMYQDAVMSSGVRWISPFSLMKSSLAMLFVMLTSTNPSFALSLYRIMLGKNAPFFK